MAWRWAAASVIGTSHTRNGNRLQDAYAVSELAGGRVFAVVSDGAGSATSGAFGAWLTCRTLLVRLREWAQYNPGLPSDERLAYWIEELRVRIANVAARRGTVPRQFAATLAALVITSDEVIALQVGDSAVVGRACGRWDVLCWPENGEYASSTYFVTDDPDPRLDIVRREREHDAFVLFSDGVGDLALSHMEQAAHPRFFDPMIHPVDIAPGKGRLTDLSGKLAEYLSSSSVCERTDDDKTLILISGR